MASVPRNRRAPTSPRQKLVLKLNQIRCVECDGSANCAYLRPFRTYWTPDGWVTHCRLHAPIPLPEPARLNAALAAPPQPEPSQSAA